MILNQIGQVFDSGPFKELFYVGQEIVANSYSHYIGLTGVITQIVDGDDLETENPGPDIYCEFDLSAPQNALNALAARERLDLVEDMDILSEIIMAPEMLEPKMKFQYNPFERQMYILTCFVDCSSENDDYMLCISHDKALLKKKLAAHVEQNLHLKDQEGLWKSEEDADNIYRMSFRDNGELYVCYSIIPVNYEWSDKNAQ